MQAKTSDAQNCDEHPSQKGDWHKNPMETMPFSLQKQTGDRTMQYHQSDGQKRIHSLHLTT